jgi:putative DNA primase/helicase
MQELKQMARALEGEASGGQMLCPGPGHSRQDRSLAVRIGKSGEIIVYSFCGDDWRECRDFVKARLGLRGPEMASTQPSAKRESLLPSRPQNAASAARIWHESLDPHGTIVERYLQTRGLELLDDAANEAIRFHPDCPFCGSRTAAMVCLVRDILTNTPLGIHRTALSRDGRKTAINGKSRAALGPLADGAIKLSPDDHVEMALGIGEGVESTLSLRATEYGSGPVWAVLNNGGVESFPVLAGIEALWIAVDHDPAGIRAAEAAASRWRDAGRETILVETLQQKFDLNDSVQAVTK